MTIPEHEPLPAATPPHPPSPTTTAPPPGKWGPYSDAADFTANMTTILVALFCAMLLAVAANALVRHLLRRRRRNEPHRLPVTGADNKDVPAAATTPTPNPPPVLVFSARAANALAGHGPPECAICLTHFHDGDRVRVIDPCKHGFHVHCVEAWLAARPSCPTCRSTCSNPYGAPDDNNNNKPREANTWAVSTMELPTTDADRPGAPPPAPTSREQDGDTMEEEEEP